ncbi:MAG: Non-heme chloroperoxidase [Acidimicrobiales bacterium]|nr:Non-heme chloroperoxidase [Acidimicrobiales bacterium]
MPLVVVHGFTAEGFLYAQTLSRLVSSGFKVVAIDTAGHGGTAGLTGGGGGDLAGYSELLGRVIDHLGIKRAILAGHSMGGRLVTEYAANHPERAIAVLLVDAIVGEAWDRRVAASRVAPPLMLATGAVLLADTLTTLPVLKDRTQAIKLGRLWAPVWLHNMRRPWGILGAGVSILRSGPSRWMLERLAEHLVPVMVIHGDRDVAVPLQTAKDAARRARGELIVVHGATHSWPLKDPDTMPAIVADLLADSLGEACRVAVTQEGLPLDVDDLGQIEGVLCERGALVIELTPEIRFERVRVRKGTPRYRWTRSWPR